MNRLTILNLYFLIRITLMSIDENFQIKVQFQKNNLYQIKNVVKLLTRPDFFLYCHTKLPFQVNKN
ncbi:hypothetical protein BpHYR1_037086 [Brachionus plicatilis]|uniref:Uncharacterized protein n=1 Tax=Brachionus plicatilis TaxID=10195 RepID=A0A3M7SBX3_BRAPC|nr:hypothetical protein BpHYR1_037086 [Brachionus plicatilis]